MKCGACNFENPPGARFCSVCGASVAAEQQITAEPAPVQAPVEEPVPVQPEAIVPEQPPVQPAPRRVVTPEQKQQKKQRLIAGVLAAVQILLYLALAGANVGILFLETGVQVQSAFDEGLTEQFSRYDLVGKLLSGGEGYNPTALSVILGVSLLLLSFGSALFWLAAAVTKPLGKGHKASHTLAVMVTALHGAAEAVVLMLACRFSKLVEIYARQVNWFAEDVKSVASLWSYVFPGICLVLVALELICAGNQKKLGKKEA